MDGKYFVLYKRDQKSEHMDKVKGRMLYDKIEEFADREKALEYALSNLQDTPILAKTIKSPQDFNAEASYVVAAYFGSKYGYTDYGGDYNDVPTHEVVRTKLGNLDSVVEELASEGPNRLYLGIEEKLIPSVVDRINSVNNQGNRNRDYR
ncbi:hypothetical protein HN695_02560 [Candidatus Woesearchaeota archaeon]|jgi:hypothetical protein|nr:hypothetical protein [Candidatus Woesearchaeota archaeon]MBT5272967.1 hypothetical protein [Candidatus Woesearchaeota archaeon]MBT6041433.1 hypothetical protein [Candidatus Woesearchaeota archaeon]MBT6337316.1 hypothetical protein [Candidatus Woesearchaeota archaeon]MBT7927193.1 hypothetical protein [Candidatus Woesearchaeota archaeon]